MDAQLLIQQLEYPEPEQRIAAARIIGLVDEVDAYPALYRAVKTEADPAVKKAMAWAGKRLQAAQTAEYTTVDALWYHFNIDRDVFPPEDDRDEPFLGLSSHQVEMVMAQVAYETAFQKARRRNKLVAGYLIGGVGGSIVAAIGSSGDASPGLTSIMDSAVSSPNSERRRRAMPTEPTTTDIRPYIKRLLSEPDPEKRRKAALSLRDLNNPAALSALALAFIRDPDPHVSQTAHLVGKLIYWNAVYWKLEKDGWIAEEIEHRIKTLEAEEKPKRKIRRLGQNASEEQNEAPTQLSVPDHPSRPAIRRLPKPDAASQSEAPTQHARPVPSQPAPSDVPPKTKPKRSESGLPFDPEKAAIERLLQKGMAKRKRPY